MSELDTIKVNAIVTMTTASLQAIVGNAKVLVGPDAKGRFKVDTAELVNRMVSKFLMERDFESYVNDISNFPGISQSSSAKASPSPG